MRNAIACVLVGTSALLAATAAAQPAPPPPPPTTAAPTAPTVGVPPVAPASTQPAPGQPSPGQPAPGQPLPGQPPPGQLAPGQPAPGQPPPGQPQPTLPQPPGLQGQPPPGGMGPPPGAGGPFQPPQQHWGGRGPWLPPPSRPDDEVTPGVVRGLPLSRRGRIALEAAGFTDDSGEDSLLAVALDVHIPLVRRTFLDARLPMAGILPGNIMLGASHVFRTDSRGFFTLGAQIGLPIAAQRAMFAFSLPHGTWNIHEYTAHFLPVKVGLGYERTSKWLEFRLELEPVLSIPVGDHGNNAGFALQHAAELQIGHSIGGGLRAQGVAVTEDILDDAYQFSLEPFFVVRRELGFARVGLMLPIDESVAGPAFEQAWGLRLAAGLHID